MKRIPTRDIIATLLVAGAAVLYFLWVADAELPGLTGTRSTGLAVLALGFAASATAVVPSFGQLLHGNRAYLTTTALLGVVALVAGVLMLSSAEGSALTVLMAMMGALWVISTTHHTMLTRTTPIGVRRAHLSSH